jgi:hypothetical protein
MATLIKQESQNRIRSFRLPSPKKVGKDSETAKKIEQFSTDRKKHKVLAK